MTIFECRGFGNSLHEFTGLEPFEYVARFKAKQVPKGTNIEQFKRTQAPYCLSGKIKAVKGRYKRSNETLIARDLIFIDYDEITESPQAFKDRVNKALFGYSYVLYPTIKHTEQKPRYRVVVKPSQSMNEPTYRQTVKEIADLIGLPFDLTTLTWSQLQGLPITQGDPKNYDKVINKALDYPIKPIEDKQARAEPRQYNNTVTTSNQGAQYETITMRVINTLYNGFGEKGGRNIAMTKFVGLLLNRRVNCDVKMAYELTRIANDQTHPPLSIKELDTTFESIVKAEIRKRGLGLS